MKRIALLFASCAAGMLMLACGAGTKKSHPPLEVVPYVDLRQYTGTWYEIARFPHRFQEGCVATTATYTLGEDGKISVLNQCREGSLDGKLKSAQGTARVVEKTTNAKLKVSFFWPFSGHYWIIGLGDQYEYAVVGHPDRTYLWILSRSPEMEEGVYTRILKRLDAQGYDTGKLMKTLQAVSNPGVR
ncbi:MAG: lipocalin family protein [Nitrospirota bacterium]